MLLHEDPAIAAGLDYLIERDSRFAGADRSRFQWRRRNGDFAGLLKMILGQQVSVQAADSMWRKLLARLPILTPERFAALDDAALAAVGFSRQKMRYGRALSEAVTNGAIDLPGLAAIDDEGVTARLTTLPGIGVWSAQMYLMFCLGRTDVWPTGDLGIQLGMQYLLALPEKPGPAELVARAKCWRPHRSAAALLIWDHYMQVASARRQDARRAKAAARG